MLRTRPSCSRLTVSLIAPAALPVWRTGNAPSARISQVKTGLSSNSSLLGHVAHRPRQADAEQDGVEEALVVGDDQHAARAGDVLDAPDFQVEVDAGEDAQSTWAILNGTDSRGGLGPQDRGRVAGGPAAVLGRRPRWGQRGRPPGRHGGGPARRRSAARWPWRRSARSPAPGDRRRVDHLGVRGTASGPTARLAVAVVAGDDLAQHLV